MSSFVDVPTDNRLPGKPVTASLINAALDNPVSMFSGGSLAPRLAYSVDVGSANAGTREFTIQEGATGAFLSIGVSGTLTSGTQSVGFSVSLSDDAGGTYETATLYDLGSVDATGTAQNYAYPAELYIDFETGGVHGVLHTVTGYETTTAAIAVPEDDVDTIRISADDTSGEGENATILIRYNGGEAET